MSIGFLIASGLILIMVVAGISAPFWRKDPENPRAINHKTEEDQELADLTVEREVLTQSLGDLEVELAQGRLERDDYERLKTTDERRLLKVLDRLEELKSHDFSPNVLRSDAAPASSPWIVAVIPGILVILLSGGIYGYMQWQAVQRLVALQTEMGSNAPDPREMVARLEARLRENPDNLEGQILAGRSYVALQRVDEAKNAWTKVLELDPRNHEAHFNLGVILIETRKFDDPEIFEKALLHFDQVLVDLPNQPGANWYRGVALWYLKRYRETEDAWALTYKNLDPRSQDGEFVKTALQKLRSGETPF